MAKLTEPPGPRLPLGARRERKTLEDLAWLLNATSLAHVVAAVVAVFDVIKRWESVVTDVIPTEMVL